MAVTQTATDKCGITNIAQKDALGYYFTTLGSIRIYIGSGSPNAVITTAALCPIGSIYQDVTSGSVYIMTVTTGTWVVVGTQT